MSVTVIVARCATVLALLFLATASGRAQGSFGSAAAAPVDTTPAAPKAPKAPRQRMLSIVVPMSKEKAIDVVTAVLLDGGYQIAETGPSLVQTMELPRYGNTAGFVLRANIVSYATGDSTRVILTGSFFNSLALGFTRALAGERAAHDAHSGEGEPVESYTWGVQSKLWARLTSMAEAISKAGGGYVRASAPPPS